MPSQCPLCDLSLVLVSPSHAYSVSLYHSLSLFHTHSLALFFLSLLLSLFLSLSAISAIVNPASGLMVLNPAILGISFSSNIVLSAGCFKLPRQTFV